MESSGPFTAQNKLRIDTVIRRGGFRCAPNREFGEKSILLDVTHADRQWYTCGEAVSTSEARKCYTAVGRDMCPTTNKATNLPLYRWKALGASG